MLHRPTTVFWGIAIALSVSGNAVAGKDGFKRRDVASSAAQEITVYSSNVTCDDGSSAKGTSSAAAKSSNVVGYVKVKSR